MDIRKRIGMRIKELRLSNKLTQETLSHLAEMDKTYINEVENGKRNISVINLEKIIKALGSTLEVFFSSPIFLPIDGDNI